MSGAEILSAMADFLTVIMGLAVLVQLRLFVSQLKLDAMLKVLGSNRELILEGVRDPALLGVISMEGGVSLNREQRYAQLWINQMQLIFDANAHGFMGTGSWASLERDLADFSALPKIREVWNMTKTYYPADFQKFMDGLIKQSA